MSTMCPCWLKWHGLTSTLRFWVEIPYFSLAAWAVRYDINCNPLRSWSSHPSTYSHLRSHQWDTYRMWNLMQSQSKLNPCCNKIIGLQSFNTAKKAIRADYESIPIWIVWDKRSLKFKSIHCTERSQRGRFSCNGMLDCWGFLLRC